MTVKITKFKSNLDDLKPIILDAIGKETTERAKRYCPVDTGNLRRSIQYVIYPEEGRVVIGTNVDYAPYIEYGTLRIAKANKTPSPPWGLEMVKNPLTSWKAAEERGAVGQRMPFLRPALFEVVHQMDAIAKKSR